MDTANQGGSAFNYKAYGLVARLLWANIPVKWAIRANKKTMDPDISGLQVTQIYGTGSSVFPRVTSFYHGPFIVENEYINEFKTVMQNVSVAALGVWVFKSEVPFQADIRYTILHKPKIGILLSASAYTVHEAVALAGGFERYSHYDLVNIDDPSVINAASCYTMLSEPHWDSGWAEAVAFNGRVRVFLESGGNFFGQCEGTTTYENCDIQEQDTVVKFTLNPVNSATDCNSVFMTDGGFYKNPPDSGTPVMKHQDIAFMQFPNFIQQGGSLKAFDLKRSPTGVPVSNFRTFQDPVKGAIPLGYMTTVVNSSRIQGVAPNEHTAFSATAKLSPFFGKTGGNVWYLAGHQYGTGSVDGGLRMFLNSAFIPSARPQACGLSFKPKTACVLFDPYSHGQYVYTPGCLPHITLDPGVGTSVKTCSPTDAPSTVFVALPVGWEVVTMDAYSKNLTMTFGHPAEWEANCICGTTPGATSPQASTTCYTPSGAPCSAGTVGIMYDINDPSVKCYNITGCGGNALMIRMTQHDDNCNALNYGLYCSNNTGSASYVSTFSKDASSVYINLYSNSALSIPFRIPLYNRINIMLLEDQWNTIRTSSINDLGALTGTLHYAWDYGSYAGKNVGMGYIAADGTFRLHTALTWQRSVVQAATAPAVTLPTGSGSPCCDSPAIGSVAALLNDNSIGWYPDTYRVIWLVTKSFPRTSQISQLATAMTSGPGAGTILIIGTTSDKVLAWNNACTGIPRCKATTIVYPTGTTSSSGVTTYSATAAQGWISAMHTASLSYVGKLTLTEVHDPLGFATATPVTTIPNFGASGTWNDPAWYNSSLTTFSLPAGSPAFTLPPYNVTVKVEETGRLINAIISWQAPPTLLAPTLTYNFTDASPLPLFVPVVDSIRSKLLDPNVNKLYITYLSQNYISTDPATGWISSNTIYEGDDWGKPFALFTPFNSLGLEIVPYVGSSGVVEFTYTLSDGCFTTPPGVIRVTFSQRNPPPKALPIVLNGTAGFPLNFDLAAYISDTGTPDSGLKIVVFPNTNPTVFGTLSYLNPTTGSYASLPLGGSFSTGSVDYQDLQFLSSSNQTEGNRTWTYRVYDAEGLYAESTITIIQNRQNLPPAITVNPPSLVTPPGTAGPWSVTITDSTWDIVSLWVASTSLTTSQITQIGSTSPSLPLTQVSSPVQFLGNLPTTTGSVTIPFSWTPSLDHSYGLTHNVTFFAMDSTGLFSPTNVTVTLTVPPNQSPSCVATTSTTTVPQTTTEIPIKVSGTDPNAADRERLSIKVTQLPDPIKGTLYFGSTLSTATPVTLNQVFPYNLAPQVAGSGVTSFNFIYVPTMASAASTSQVTDSFKYVFVDRGNAESQGVNCGVTLTLTLVPKPPTSQSVTRTATQNVPLSFSIPGFDPDNDVQTMEILSLNLNNPSTTTLNFYNPTTGTTTPVTVGATFPISSGVWNFQYLTSSFTSFTDTFTYRVIDSTNRISPTYTGTISTTRVYQNPTVQPVTVTTPEDTPVSIPFPCPATVQDPDSTCAQLSLSTVTSPVVGTLTNPDGSTVTVGANLVPNPTTGVLELVFTPPPNYSGTVTFTVKATDEGGRTSPPATVTVNVTPVDDPPTLTLSPTIQTVPRGTAATYTARVTDVDSNMASVYLATSSIPFGVSTFSATVNGVTTTYDVTTALPDTLLGTVTKLADGTFPPVTISWTPSPSAPDGTAGNFQLYATATGQTSNTVSGNFNIIPNNPPTPTGSYSVVQPQNAPPLPLTIKGTDPDVYLNHHLDSDIYLVSVGPGVTVQQNGVTLAPGTAVPLVTNADGTIGVRSDITLVFANNYNGQTQIVYRLQDPLGAWSVDQVVPITVNFVNQPPTCTDTAITLRESYCTLPPCTLPDSNVAMLTASGNDFDDPNSLTFQITTASIQNPGVGRLMYFDSLSYKDFQTSTSLSGSSWNFWYIPEAYRSSPDCIESPPGSGAWSCITPFTRYPYTVTDPRGQSSPTCYLTVFVYPANDPPTSQNYFFSLESPPQLSTTGASLPFSIVVQDPDGALDITSLEIQSVTYGILTLSGENGQVTFNGAPLAVGSLTTPNTPDLTAKSKTWDFVYTIPSYVPPPNDQVDVITFIARDAASATSIQYSVTIRVTSGPALPPIAAGSTYYGQEGEPVTVNFVYGSAVGTTTNYYDPDAFPISEGVALTSIRIESLPANGVLYTTDYVPVQIGNVINNGYNSESLIFVPDDNWSGSTTFDFVALDSQSSSNLATMTIEVSPVDNPPVMGLTPSAILVERGTSDYFVATVTDVDSPSVEVFVQSSTLPTDVGSVSVTINGVTTDYPTGITAGTSLGVISKDPITGEFPTVTVTWSADISAPDGTSGTIELFARDASSSSNVVTGTASIPDNLAPTVIDDPGYVVSVAEDSPTFNVDLFGTDPNVFHQTNLVYTITSYSPGITVGGITAMPGTGQTLGTVPVTVDPLFSGTATFTFTVTDALGLTSAPQTVTITVTHVNHPPTTQDVTIIVKEDTCYLACSLWDAVRAATITASDVDVIDAGLLTLGFPTAFPLNYDTSGILINHDGSQVSIVQSPTSTFSEVVSNWDFLFDPLEGVDSAPCQKDTSGNIIENTCQVLLSIPFTVSDPAGGTASALIHVIVVPVPHPPTTESVNSVATSGTPTTIVIPGTDVDGNLITLFIDSVSLLDPDTMLLGPDGLPVTPGSSYDLTSLSPAGTWTFTYLNNDYRETTDTFTYHVGDDTPLTSTIETATITVPRSALAPVAYDQGYTTPEGVEINIPLVFGDIATNPESHYFDTDGSAVDSTITIASLPTNGVLIGPEGELSVGSVLSSPWVVWRPTTDFDGSVAFDFTVTDIDGLTSNVGTITVDVVPEDDPPVISLDPYSILVDRTQTGTFTATVSDIDSPTIEVYVKGFTVPLEYGSSFIVNNGPPGSVVSYAPSTLPNDDSLVITLDYGALPLGSPLSFTLDWTAGTALPDGSTGTFTLYASSDDSGTPTLSNEVTGFVGVTPNNPPSIVEEPGYPYTFTGVEDTFDNHTFRLAGTDPDPWHDGDLVVTLTSLPDGGALFYPNGTQIVAPGPIDNHVPFTDVIFVPFPGWNGTTSFSFFVTDPMGASSPIQDVLISLDGVPHPPYSQDELLIVPEEFCIFTWCNAPEDRRQLAGRYSILQHFDLDVEDTEWWIEFQSPPDPSVGTVGYYDASGNFVTLTGPVLMSSNYPWDFWFQPAPNAHSTGCIQAADGTFTNCDIYTNLQFRVYDVNPNPISYIYSTDDSVPPTPVYWNNGDFTNHVSSWYNWDIIVTPINDPPTSQNLVFTIKEDEVLVVYYEDGNGVKVEYLPAFDPDNVDSEITAFGIGTAPGSQGGWYYKDSTTGDLVLMEWPDLTTNIDIPGRYLVYIPPPNVYSDPGRDLSTLYFQVEDPDGLVSPTYSVRVIVDPVVDEPVPLFNETTMLEDTQTQIVLSGRDVRWTSADPGDATFLVTGLGPGTFSVCDVSGCTPLTSEDILLNGPVLLAEGRLTYQPLLNEFAQNYSYFNYSMAVVDPAYPNLVTWFNFTHWIHVDPVNDPPVLHPQWFKPPQEVECDEDTFVKVWFNASDIDSPLSVLTAEAILVLDSLSAKMYTCGGVEDLNSNCSGTERFISGGLGLPFAKWSDGVWNVSFIPEPNWNGKLYMVFIVWDEFLMSNAEPVKVRVWPINDAPTIVKGSTSIKREYYDTGIAKKPDPKRAVIDSAEEWTLVTASPEEVAYTIHDARAAKEKDLPGVLLEKKGDPKGTIPTLPEQAANTKNEVVTIYRLRTKLQDIDFFFQYSLNMTASLIHAVWVPALFAPNRPCEFNGLHTVICYQEILKLNDYLSISGLPILIDDDSDSAIGLFLLDDTGNIDKWQRPLLSGFTIEFWKGEDIEEVVVPIAAVVILPVIAAATAAAVAAAWFTLGNRARDYAGASFDAFAVTNQAGGNVSPLYDPKGLEVNSALYAGSKH